MAIANTCFEGLAARMNDNGHERRMDKRERTGARLRIAYVRGAGLPADRNLVDVECQDVSRSGCGFWTLNPPEHLEVLMVFGEGAEELRLKAKVVRWQVAEHNGRLRTLVGCQFAERLMAIPKPPGHEAPPVTQPV
jgi:hypothetical protein